VTKRTCADLRQRAGAKALKGQKERGGYAGPERGMWENITKFKGGKEGKNRSIYRISKKGRRENANRGGGVVGGERRVALGVQRLYQWVVNSKKNRIKNAGKAPTDRGKGACGGKALKKKPIKKLNGPRLLVEIKQ